MMLVILLFFSVARLDARKKIKFENISIEQGLSQSTVECIMQDKTGFMWMGTEYGLNKYDGYGFSIYKQIPDDPQSLTHNNILCLLEDTAGYLWVGTFHGGLNRLDLETGLVKRFKRVPEDPGSLSNDVVRTIYQDRLGTIWVGTDNGLNRFDKEKETFTHFYHDPANPHSLSFNQVRAICEDRDGNFWIGTNGGGLNKLDRESQQFTSFKHTPGTPHSLSSNHIWVLYEDVSGALWIGTYGGGLNRFDAASGRFKVYRQEKGNPHSLSNNFIRDICEDHARTLWLGTDGGLIAFDDRRKERFATYRKNPDEPGSVSGNQIHAIYEDRSGILWIGTYGGGINKFNTKKKKFVHYQVDPRDANSLSHNIVWAMFEDENGHLWIGTHGGGLNKFDRANNRFTHYRANPANPTALNNDSVRLIHLDRTGAFWIGTNGGGLNKMDREKEVFTHYTHDPENPNSISHNELRAIYEDRSGVLWLGTHGGGLSRFNRKTETFTQYRTNETKPNSLSNDVIRTILEDDAGTFWIGTYGGGLNKMDRETGTFTHYRADHKDPRRLSNDYIFTLHESRAGEFWIGTWGGGLNRLDRETGTFYRLGVEDGLPDAAIYGILEDERGNLWISTNNGLSKFNPSEKRFKNYYDIDGLQCNEFNGGAYYKSKQGEMFFGGIKGISAFFPDAIHDNHHVPPVVITTFEKLNKQVKLRRSITSLEVLVLSYKDYFFSFQFSALDYTMPGKNQYAYRMEPLDGDWITTDSTKRFATYTTLAPGEYVFRVRGSNNDGVWNEKGTSLLIIITPPFWATWWFRTLVVLVVFFVSLTLYRRKMKHLFLRTRMETELQTAHAAQMSIMPHEGPILRQYDITGSCMPASEVGGDFYDYLWLDRTKKQFGIAVGDVSGKAMKAAMTAVMSDGIIFSKATETDSISEIIERLNQSLYLKTEKQVFTALLLVSLDVETRGMSFINAGLPRPLLKSGDNVSHLDGLGSRIPPGMMKDSRFQEKTIPLKPGEVLVLYTDGMSESWNSEHELYGSEKLAQCLEKMDTVPLTSQEILTRIMADIKSFTGDMPQHDDMTVVVVKVL